MRSLLFALLATLGLVGGASSLASAAPLSLESSTLQIDYASFSTLSFGQSPASVPIAVAGDGSFTEPASVFVGSGSVSVCGILCPTVFAASIANGTKIVAPGGGPGGGFGGTGGISGSLSLSVIGGLIVIPIPLGSVGVGGIVTSFFGATGVVKVTGAGWTTGQAVVTGISTLSPSGGTIFTAARTGFDNRTVNGVGTLKLVSAARVLGSATGNSPMFFTQTLTFFVPEPYTFTLLAAGGAGLAVLGRRRRRPPTP